jgi:hypothetical protein
VRAIADRFVNDDVTIANLDVVQTRGIGADPCFVLDRSSLATEIRKRNQITFTTLATPGKCVFHEIASFLHIGGFIPGTQCARHVLTKMLSFRGASASASASPQQDSIYAVPILSQVPLLCQQVCEEFFIFLLKST